MSKNDSPFPPPLFGEGWGEAVPISLFGEGRGEASPLFLTEKWESPYGGLILLLRRTPILSYSFKKELPLFAATIVEPTRSIFLAWRNSIRAIAINSINWI